jgi:hypothetical protein
MTYSLHTANGSLTADQIISALNPAIPLQAAHIQAIRNLQRDMCRYSYQDLDVLSAAHTVAVKNETEVSPWNAKWVEAMTR